MKKVLLYTLLCISNPLLSMHSDEENRNSSPEHHESETTTAWDKLDTTLVGVTRNISRYVTLHLIATGTRDLVRSIGSRDPSNPHKPMRSRYLTLPCEDEPEKIKFYCIAQLCTGCAHGVFSKKLNSNSYSILSPSKNTRTQNYAAGYAVAITTAAVVYFAHCTLGDWLIPDLYRPER